jgi:hypothetical protein
MRWCFVLLAPFHLVCLLYIDVYMYNFEIAAIIMDMAFLWMDYFNFMTMNKLIMCFQVGAMGATCLIAIFTHF